MPEFRVVRGIAEDVNGNEHKMVVRVQESSNEVLEDVDLFIELSSGCLDKGLRLLKLTSTLEYEYETR